MKVLFAVESYVYLYRTVTGPKNGVRISKKLPPLGLICFIYILMKVALYFKDILVVFILMN